MALNKKVLAALRKRDDHCWHCGAGDEYLVPHHRKNRQAGGSKERENDITNLLLICAYWNGIIESQAVHAYTARMYGQKLRSWEQTDKAVYDAYENRWYRLTPEGNKVSMTNDDKPF